MDKFLTADRFFLGILLLLGAATWAPIYAMPELQTAEGLNIELFAEVPNARQMALSPNQTLFIGTRRLDKVFALPVDKTGGRSQLLTVAEGLSMPAGVALNTQGHLYIAATHEIHVLKFAELAVQKKAFSIELVTNQLPNHRHHGWKHIRFNPKGHLVIPVGMPCNVCLPNHEFQGTLQSLNLSTGKWLTLVKGVRNSIGFDWHPETGRLWFSDNGRDWLGDDIPHDEINEVTRVGEHFGFPFEHGDRLPESDQKIFDAKPPNIKFKPPTVLVPAHSAPLGIHFYRGTSLPKRYRGALFVALHGSWNRSSPSGYLINAYWFDEQGILLKQETVVEGFLSSSGKTLGRPVDFAEMEDGSILISDDYGGRIWRLSGQ